MRRHEKYPYGHDVYVPRLLAVAVGVSTVLAIFLIAGKAAGGEYGAISYSPEDGAYGYSVFQPTREEAEKKALAACRERGSDCRKPVWFVNACGAIAVASDGPWGQDWGHSQRQAIKKAIDWCTKYGGKDCKELFSTCSRD